MADWWKRAGLAALSILGLAAAACGSGTATGAPSERATAAASQSAASAVPTATTTALATPGESPSGVATGSPPASAPAASEGTGSLVYIADFNVWLAAPDGTAARQLTTDGTHANAYHDPSQSDDGRIFALRGTRTLVQLDRQGQPLAAPVSLNALENGAEGLTVSPDGKRLAYVTTGYGTEIDPRFGTPAGTYLYGGTDVAKPDGVSVPGAAVATLLFPSWRDPDHLIGSDGVDLYQATIGVEMFLWLRLTDGCLAESLCEPGQPAAANVSLPVRSADDRVMAYTYKPYFGTAGRRMASVSSGPSSPPITRCLLPDQENSSDPGTFSPHGDKFVYDDARFNPDTFAIEPSQGIWAMSVDLEADDCGASTAHLVIPGGSQPAWGPAAP
jgi:hypothetical protein